MLITKHGNEGEIKAFRCPKCGCEFLANAHEYGQFVGLEDGTKLCSCPECRRMAKEIEE